MSAVDPKAAVEELGALTEQIKELWTDGRSWDVDTRAEKRRTIVDTYVRVFAPAVAFSGVSLAVSLSAFLVVLAALSVSGRGYDDIAGFASNVPLLGGALQQVDAGWGNAAISLLLVELSAPVLLPLVALATPTATEALQEKLTASGFDAEGINAKMSAMLGEKPSPPPSP